MATDDSDDPFSLLPHELLKSIIESAIKNPGHPKNSVTAMRSASRFLTTAVDRTNVCLVLGGPSLVKAAAEQSTEEAGGLDTDEIHVEEEDEEEEPEVKLDFRKDILPIWIKLVERSSEGISTLSIHKKITWQQVKAFISAPKYKEKLTRSIEEINLLGLSNTCKMEDLSPFTKLTKLSVAGCKKVSQEDLTSLRSITHLDISECSRIYSLSQLSMLTNLESLTASGLKLQSLAGLSSCTKLRTLVLINNKVLSNISALSTLINLQSLNMAVDQSWWSASVNEYSSIQFCTSLTRLDLSRHMLDNPKSFFLSSLTNLQHLNLFSCNVLTSLSCLETLRELISLEVSSQITTITPLSLCTKLESLTLKSSKIGDISGLLSCPRLKHVALLYLDSLTDVSGLVTSAGSIEVLDLSGCKSVTTESLNTVLQAASRLVDLKIYGINAAGLKLHPGTMMSLRSLNVSGTAINQFDFLSDLALLKSLNLSHNKHLLSLENLQACVDLESLKLGYCLNLKDICALPFISGLKELDFSGYSRIFTQSQMESLSASTSIKKLNLSGCNGLYDIDFLSGMTNLFSLNLSHSPLVDDLESLSSLVKLEVLNLSTCPLIDDLGPLSTLVKLLDLDISACPLLDDLDPLSFLVRLRSLNIKDCPLIIDLSPLMKLEHSLKKIRISTAATHTNVYEVMQTGGAKIRKTIVRK